MFTFMVLSTVEASDPFETIHTGDTLHHGDCNYFFPTESAAVFAGKQVLRSTRGGPAYAKARESAMVVAINVGPDAVSRGEVKSVVKWGFDRPKPQLAAYA